MEAVIFSKAFAEQALEALDNGKPLEAPSGCWTRNDMVTLAGILYGSVITCGSIDRMPGRLPRDILDKVHPERREAVEEEFCKDVHEREPVGEAFCKDLNEAIYVVARLTLRVMQNDYDANHEAEVVAITYTDKDGNDFVFPIEGFKNRK